jgi:hypothetical protein
LLQPLQNQLPMLARNLKDGSEVDQQHLGLGRIMTFGAQALDDLALTCQPRLPSAMWRSASARCRSSSDRWAMAPNMTGVSDHCKTAFDIR